MLDFRFEIEDCRFEIEGLKSWTTRGTKGQGVNGGTALWNKYTTARFREIVCGPRRTSQPADGSRPGCGRLAHLPH